MKLEFRYRNKIQTLYSVYCRLENPFTIYCTFRVQLRTVNAETRFHKYSEIIQCAIRTEAKCKKKKTLETPN